MKLRIKGDSLRLRLTQSEVHRLTEEGAVEDRVRFAPGQSLVYRVRRDAQAERMGASYTEGLIDVWVPDGLAREWCGTDQVTLAHSQNLPGGELRIVVEKDFACLTPGEGEDESDNFPHPLKGQGTC